MKDVIQTSIVALAERARHADPESAAHFAQAVLALAVAWIDLASFDADGEQK